MVVNGSKKMPIKYECGICDFKCSKKSNYTKHLSTDKHKTRENDSKKMPKKYFDTSCDTMCDEICSSNNEKIIQNLDDTEKMPKKCQKNADFRCNCGKTYKYNTGYYRHKKICDINKIDASNNHIFDKELIMMLIKENNDLKKMIVEEHKSTQDMMLEVIKNGTHHNTTISHNKTFNLNFFLNETCKDAMNIMDFVNSVKIQLTDLENMGDVGYINGMSNIIIKNLQDLDISERPVHCTDIKREVLYVKDADKWDKEVTGNPKFRNAIKQIAHKNSKLLNDFREKHPDCMKSESKHSDTYSKLMMEAMGGKGNNDVEKENKIIRKVANEVVLPKEM